MSIKWFGGKSQLVNRLLLFIPPHNKYIEVFGGAAHFYFAKDIASTNVYNDLNESLVNLWKVLKNYETKEILKEFLYFTPYSREMIIHYANYVLDNKPKGKLDVGHAWALLVRLYLTVACLGGTMKPLRQGSYGVGYTTMSLVNKFMNLQYRFDELHDKLAYIEIEGNDFSTCILGHDSSDSFFYCDPPYLIDGDTRSTDNYSVYQREFSWEDHMRLRNILFNVKGKVLLSYNHTGYIMELYRGWNINIIYRNKGSKIMEEGKERPKIPEVIIRNY